MVTLPDVKDLPATGKLRIEFASFASVPFGEPKAYDVARLFETQLKEAGFVTGTKETRTAIVVSWCLPKLPTTPSRLTVNDSVDRHRCVYSR